MRRRVEWRDIDAVGHVNNAVYLAYVEDCGVQVSAAHGWPMQRMEAEGLGVYARGHRIEYLEPALLDDDLELSTWIVAVQRATIRRYVAITRVADGALVAQAIARWVGVDLETGRPIRVAATFLDDFASNLSPAIITGWENHPQKEES